MNELTETQKAYLAGFFDGEGCVSIGKYQGKNNRTPVYQLQIVIAQKTPLMAELCQQTGLGSVLIHNHQNGHTYHQWRMSPRDGYDFLQAILPYLREKAAEARLAIKFQSEMTHKNSLGKGHPASKEQVSRKESYYQALRVLKGRSGASGGRGRPRTRQE